jgi:hypothetical protein
MLAAEQFSTAAFAGFNTRGSSEAGQRTLPYSLVVHAYSNISLHARSEQTGFEPGAYINLHGSVAQSGVPLAHRAQVWAEVKRPDGSATTVAMGEYDDGQFAGQLATSIPGVYRLRIRASGTTLSGEPFARERLLTGAVWRGGDRPDAGNNGQVIVDYLRDRDARLCELLNCLLQRDGVITPELEKWLRELGLDPDRARKCVAQFCHGR